MTNKAERENEGMGADERRKEAIRWIYPGSWGHNLRHALEEAPNPGIKIVPSDKKVLIVEDGKEVETDAVEVIVYEDGSNFGPFWQKYHELAGDLNNI